MRNIFVVLIATILFSGCLMNPSKPLDQETARIRISPLSSECAQINEKRICVLLAETSTGKEEYKFIISDSLVRSLEEYGKSGFLIINFLFGQNSNGSAGSFPAVMSFSDFGNKVNDKNLYFKYAEMKKLYKENGIFPKEALCFIGGEIGVDYFCLPRLLEIDRREKGRLSIFGLKVMETKFICLVAEVEIWDAKTGYKVFSATVDVTVSSEDIREGSISLERAFDKAWSKVIKELVASRY
jgi:hypothetical protein